MLEGLDHHFTTNVLCLSTIMQGYLSNDQSRYATLPHTSRGQRRSAVRTIQGTVLLGFSLRTSQREHKQHRPLYGNKQRGTCYDTVSRKFCMTVSGLESYFEIVLGSLFGAKSCMRWSNFERRHRHHPSSRRYRVRTTTMKEPP